jgi:hypothetical protein
MRSLAVITAALFLLAAPAGAAAQGGDPVRPVLPPGEPEEPEPAPPPEADDQALGTTETLALAGIALLLIGAVGVVIAREGGRLRRGARRRRRARRTRRRREQRRGGVTPLRSTAPVGAGRGDAKRPPPPPRKRRSKAKRR